MNLKGKGVKLSIVTVGGKVSEIESTQYTLYLVDRKGQKLQIEALGMDKISSSINPVDVAKIAEMFNIHHSEINRPTSGEIDLLIGMQYAAYHPVRMQAIGHLLLLQNRFGTTIGGSHPSINEATKIDSVCQQVKHAEVLHTSIERFFDIEGLGIMCNPKCGSCKCGKCHPGGKDMTLKDEREYKIIEANVQFNAQTGRWMAEYPWTRDPKELASNRNVAYAILRSTERRLMQNEEHAALYARQIEDLLDRKAAREVTQAELNNFEGVKFYLSHHAVMKPDSKSTPCRIVFNSSARIKGLSLNDCLAKGPSLLNVLLGILLRFRQNHVAFIGDISKMYHSIDINLKDQMTHLFLWRNFQCEAYPRTYAMTAVNMGDRPSATIAQIALRKTAEEVSKEYPDESDVILNNSYMDDISGSIDTEETALRYMKNIEQILNNKGFKIKEWIYNGKGGNKKSSDQEQVQVLMGVSEDGDTVTEGVLGMRWEVKEYVLKCSRSATRSNYHSTATKRSILSAVNSVYDPVGFLTPFTVKTKILLRKIWSHEPPIDWDDDLPTHIAKQWEEIRAEFEEIKNVAFRRPIIPAGAQEDPMLVLFSDGSEQAYAAAAYIRWKVGDQAFVARLAVAKSRMAPVKTIDIVRIELCGAVLSKRLRCMIEKEMTLKFKKVVHLVDSEIVHAMVNRESYGFNTFVANRVGEIRQGTNPEEWAWIEGKPWLNVADVATRGCNPNMLKLDSLWQTGPEFLSQPEEEWPIRKEVKKDLEYSGMKKSKENPSFVGVAEEKETLAGRIDSKRFSKWKLLQCTTARILKLYNRFKEGANNAGDVSPTDLIRAEEFWIKESQSGMNLKKHVKLQPVEVGGIVRVGGRTERWMECTWNKQSFVLLPKDSWISELIARYEHDKGGHLGQEATISKIRSKYWIVGVRGIVRKIIRGCRKCKEKLRKTENQIMSPLPVERIKPSPPFANVNIDYFGPFVIRGEVQKRVRGKCFGVIITCLSSRAAYVDVAEDYSTDGFLKVLRRFSSIRGWPTKIYSDNGTQLVGASNELKTIVKNIDWQKMKEYSHNNMTEWNFSPGNAPWYNGAAEALVKCTKRALNAMVGDQIMTFAELQTVMFEVAQLLNQRPIGVQPKSPNDGTYLCPNDLLLGRSTSHTPQGPFQERSSKKFRLDFLQSIVGAFWKRWTREVFPTLVIQPKWHTEQRNLKIGDVVLVQDSNLVRGKWRMAVVSKSESSEDGRVRRVKLKYKSENNTPIEIERAVQRLILLVPVDGIDNQ